MLSRKEKRPCCQCPKSGESREVEQPIVAVCTCVTALYGSCHVLILPDGPTPCRRSGASDAPMPAKEAVPFASPESLAVEVRLPHAGRVRGMGVRAGVTLVVGGGFHGKSTLLEALQAGVYNKARRRVLAETREVRGQAHSCRVPEKQIVQGGLERGCWHLKP